ncbi:RNA polymerase sigma factor [Pedobacter heparinus]|uniref:RNA polymerase sigma-70 factor n=1 Tax=Pedobacter heparinus (strain ATCC 13125 / DSM 2366 / CIP 104194 / JCM 7457 / NBRC 12017 / NCIMB 9290 / NRRL B-14731 / HIM 762-3) TaxID=485917 RepID=C6XSL3_PEDHD|nr:RNA polymerase sigma-70 factor [Pedobacter heparinus]ACU05576.1 RNA polymerase sigma-70 factor [Pedobacter heparinus DSM 2366]
MSGYNSISDHELIAQLKRGNRDAFTEIYDRYFWQLHAHAYKWMRNREETRDIIHELFLTLWEKRETLSFEHGLLSYLSAAVRNRIFNLLAHKRIESKYLSSLDDFINEGICITDHLIREKQLTSLIENEISGMPAKMREVFELSRKENLSHKEIAEQLDISELTVRKHVQHALKILRFKLGFYLLMTVLTAF